MLAALCAAASLAAAQVTAGDALPTAATPAERDLWAKAEAALVRVNAAGASDEAARASAEEAAHAFETAAAASSSPGPAWLRAARVRKASAETAGVRAAAVRGGPAAPFLEAAAREAQVCADDARRAWKLAAPEASLAAQAGKPSTDVAALVSEAAAEPFYLEAVCAGIWARAQGVTPLLERAAELRAALARVAALAPELDEAGPDRELGRLLAAIPAYAGGELDSAKAHFERALKIAPVARTRVAYAEGVAVKIQDRKLFQDQLALVVASADDKSAIADKARALLQRIDELFGKAH